ncbi:hypothetical protein SAMN04488012_12016 [Palleronia salina]|uniref:Uncharacterized protein n=1 Tax=Palleronia salina TaxID=313368 RepID=A0A1M6M5B7_9RHOB|nr:hypothetical protein SAMN04488012_12016 [Palleronia salina]
MGDIINRAYWLSEHATTVTTEADLQELKRRTESLLERIEEASQLFGALRGVPPDEDR